MTTEDRSTRTERRTWEILKAQADRYGAPIHPAFRFSSWEEFSAAGRPWHNGGDQSFPNLPYGARHTQIVDDGTFVCHLKGSGALGEPGSTQAQMQERQADLIPAAVRLKMLSDANGGLGALPISPDSPGNSIRSFMDSYDKNGFLPPGNVNLS